ncbi:hypothetical protein M422DRAFT_211326 [Sphaerobolus stellatus SS14]|uniref:DDE-1 domain-containing protein n=1 Tax=Sphaerobolus stellatus (strain SS14) TaxID=990650 RepID=A0A0C9VJ19_SPHS4|nr:hypothetical protein M422DRAFT_211326 [Sphaerobolus stellatus SS14]
MKKKKKRQEADRQMDLALAAYRHQLEHVDPRERLGSRDIAQRFGVNYRTLLRLHKGGRSLTSFNKSKRLLSDAEEDVIIENWADRFVVRHRDRLQSHYARHLDKARAQGLNPQAVSHWFNVIVKTYYVDAGIRPENTYAMDESGFTWESTRTQRVIGSRGPVIIFKGQNTMSSWFSNNVADCLITHSKNGWTEQEIAEDWIQKFDVETSQKAGGAPRALFLDGHNSHYSSKLLLYAKEHNIIILGYPPHCTHVLQGLDVVFFARMKEEFGRAVEKFEEEHNRGVRKADFASVFGSAFLKAAHVDLIKSAFSATGIIPFNPDVVALEKMKPSRATSIKGTFPLVQPSPVRAVIEHLTLYRPTHFDLDPDHARPVQPLPTITEAELDPNIDPSLQRAPPHTPHRQFTHNRTINRSHPFTPSKAIRILISRLSATATGAFLVSNSPLKSITPILSPILESPPDLPTPNWDAAKHGIVVSKHTKEELASIIAELAAELTSAQTLLMALNGTLTRYEAQLIVQNIHMKKLNVALQGKEKQKDADFRIQLYPDGFGRLLTDDDVIQLQLEAQARKLAKESQKMKRKVAKENKKLILAEQRRQWELIRQEHEEASATYKKECAKLKALGVKKNQWPKAPKRRKKPTLDEVQRSLAPFREDGSDDEEEGGSYADTDDGTLEGSEDEFWMNEL